MDRRNLLDNSMLCCSRSGLLFRHPAPQPCQHADRRRLILQLDMGIDAENKSCVAMASERLWRFDRHARAAQTDDE